MEVSNLGRVYKAWEGFECRDVRVIDLLHESTVKVGLAVNINTPCKV